MRISYSCPSHLKFHITVEHWSGLVQMTGEGIDWLNAHERTYDIWMVVAYAATSAALVQVGSLNCLLFNLAEPSSNILVPYMDPKKGCRCCGQASRIARLH